MELVRNRFSWKIRNQELVLGVRTILMGVLDVYSPKPVKDKEWIEHVLDRAIQLEREGSDLLDIQPFGEVSEWEKQSTWPVSNSDEELRRLVPVVKKLRSRIDIPICVTTHLADTAERVLELGVDVIRDWSGLCVDPRMATVVNRYDAGLVLGHARGEPKNWSKLLPLSDPISGIVKDLQNSMARAREAGIDPSRIVLDPGFEHGKTTSENLLMLTNLDLLANSQRPVLVSFSGKRFLTASVRSTQDEFQYAEMAAASAALLAGVHILRVADVEKQSYVAQFLDRLFGSLEQEIDPD